VFANVAANGGDQGRHAAEGASPQALARDLGEEALDEIEPRGSGRGEVELKPRMLPEPRRYRRMLVRAVVVENEMNGLTARRPLIDGVQKRDELGMGVARLTPLDHVPLEDIQRRKEGGRPVPLIVMRLAHRHPRPQRQDRLGAIQRLNLALLIDAQHQGLRRRVQIEADNVPQFAHEFRIAAELKVSTRWGCRLCACQIRCTVAGLTRWRLANERTLQCVASGGVVCSVAFTIASTFAGPMRFLRPGRGASRNRPATPPSTYRCRHNSTVGRLIPSSWANA
jgi:hypothetical protein